MRYLLVTILGLLSFIACSNKSQDKSTDNSDNTEKRVVNVPQFDAHSAFYFVKAQVDFGPRAMNTAAHDACVPNLRSLEPCRNYPSFPVHS